MPPRSLLGVLPRRPLLDKSSRYVENAGYSPDGLTLAYIAYDSEPSPIGQARKSRLCVKPVAGGRTKVLVEGFGIRGATWAPDSQSLAYCACTAPTGSNRVADVTEARVFVVPVAGGEPKALSGLLATSPRYSTDGKKIAYVADDGEAVIRVADAEKPNYYYTLTELGPWQRGWSSHPFTWGGDTLAYYEDDGQQQRITSQTTDWPNAPHRHVWADGQEKRRLAKYDFALSPGGERLAYVTLGGPDGSQLWVAERDGSTRLLAEGLGLRHPVFSADGEALVWRADQHLFASSLRGEKVALTEKWEAIGDGQPRFSPSGHEVSYVAADGQGGQRVWALRLQFDAAVGPRVRKSALAE